MHTLPNHHVIDEIYKRRRNHGFKLHELVRYCMLRIALLRGRNVLIAVPGSLHRYANTNPLKLRLKLFEPTGVHVINSYMITEDFQVGPDWVVTHFGLQAQFLKSRLQAHKVKS